MSNPGAWLWVAAFLTACTVVHRYDGDLEICRGGIDEDIDGVIDCDDPDCAMQCDERTQCANATDDDGDRLVDCEDPDCDGTGACPEELASCADGRDNDADGRIDARDAECWPSSRVTTERCASILGGALSFGPEDFEGGVVEHDPLGTGAGDLRSVLPTPSVTAPVPSVVAREVATGALDGTRATVVLWLDGEVWDGLNPAPAVTLSVVTGARQSPRTITIALSGVGSLFLGSLVPAETAFSPYEILDGAPVRIVFTIEIVGRTVIATIDPSDTDPLTFEAMLSEDWVEGPALELGVSSAQGRGVWIESASIERPRLVRCGTALPPLGVVTLDGAERMDTSLHAIARGPGSALCGLANFRVRSAHEIVAIRSEDDGATWARGDVVALGDGFIASNGRWHALAWDPVAMRYFAVSVISGRMTIQSSADCATWSPESIAIDDVSNGGSYGIFGATTPSYAIDAQGHEVQLLVGLEDHQFALVRMRSPWGDPGTWTLAPPDTDTGATAPWSESEGIRSPRFHVRVEDHGAPVRIAAGGSSILVRGREGWVDVPDLAAEPSAEPGAYDASLLLGPAALIEDVVPPAPDVWSGRLFQNGASDLGADDGWGWIRVRIDPPGAP